MILNFETRELRARSIRLSMSVKYLLHFDEG